MAKQLEFSALENSYSLLEAWANYASRERTPERMRILWSCVAGKCEHDFEDGRCVLCGTSEEDA